MDRAGGPESLIEATFRYCRVDTSVTPCGCVVMLRPRESEIDTYTPRYTARCTHATLTSRRLLSVARFRRPEERVGEITALRGATSAGRGGSVLNVNQRRQ